MIYLNKLEDYAYASLSNYEWSKKEIKENNYDVEHYTTSYLSPLNEYTGVIFDIHKDLLGREDKDVTVLIGKNLDFNEITTGLLKVGIHYSDILFVNNLDTFKFSNSDLKTEWSFIDLITELLFKKVLDNKINKDILILILNNDNYMVIIKEIFKLLSENLNLSCFKFNNIEEHTDLQTYISEFFHDIYSLQVTNTYSHIKNDFCEDVLPIFSVIEELLSMFHPIDSIISTYKHLVFSGENNDKIMAACLFIKPFFEYADPYDFNIRQKRVTLFLDFNDFHIDAYSVMPGNSSRGASFRMNLFLDPHYFEKIKDIKHEYQPDTKEIELISIMANSSLIIGEENNYLVERLKVLKTCAYNVNNNYKNRKKAIKIAIAKEKTWLANYYKKNPM